MFDYTYLNSDPALATASAFVMALFIGSFLNVVIHRLPIMMEREWAIQCDDNQADTEPYNLSLPASSCPNCGHKIRWFENIPVISYLFLRGRCADCSTPIPLRYPAVELISAFSVAYCVSLFGLNWISLALAMLTWALICLTFIDFDHQLLPDRITLPLLWLGLLANSFNLFTTLESAVYGAMVGYLSLWGVYWLFKLATGKEGMGYGDFKLLAALGAWGGLEALPLIVLLSSAIGAVIGITLVVAKKHEQQNPMPFGPYLAIAGWVAMIWGDEITHSYLQLIGL